MTTWIIDTDGTQMPDYTSIDAWDAAEVSDRVVAGSPAIADCRCSAGAADTGGLALSLGWTTNAANNVQILVDPVHCHAGVWDNTKYRVTMGSWDEVPIDHVHLRGLQLDCPDGWGNWNTTANLNSWKLEKIIQDGGEFNSNGPGGSVWNCVFFGCLEHSFNQGTWDIYNTTFKSSGLEDGLRAWSGTYNLTNCVVFNAGTFADCSTEGRGTIAYTATDDTYPGTGNVNPGNWANVFEDHTAGDFRLKTTDTDLTDAGTDDPGAGLYADDITGKARTSPWSIGAHGTQAAAGNSGDTVVIGVSDAEAIGSGARSVQVVVSAASALQVAGTPARSAASVDADALADAQAVATPARSGATLVSASSAVVAAGLAAENASGTGATFVSSASDVSVSGFSIRSGAVVAGDVAAVIIHGMPVRYGIADVSAVSGVAAAGLKGSAGMGVIIDPTIETLTVRRTIESLTIQRTIHSI